LPISKELVVTNPEIMRGTPVFEGTRIPVDLVADMLAQAATAEEILQGYPTLNKEKIGHCPAVHATRFHGRGIPAAAAGKGKR
jgi:uncharacterized protein (DUF433 family)